MSVPPDILIVIATFCGVFALATAIASWADRIFPLVSLAALAVSAGVFVFAYGQLDDPQGWRALPNAFISVAARILN